VEQKTVTATHHRSSSTHAALYIDRRVCVRRGRYRDWSMACIHKQTTQNANKINV